LFEQVYNHTLLICRKLSRAPMSFAGVGLESLAIAAVLVAVVAFFYSNLGLGGGQLYVPIMLIFISPAMKEVVPISLMFAFATMLTSAYSHSRKELVDFRLGAYLGVAGLLGTAAGVVFTTNAPETIVKAAFATLLLIVATKMIYDIYSAKKDDDTDPTRPSGRRMIAGLGVSVLTGLLVGSFGIGGGVVSVPLIIYVFRFEPRKAIGTSAMVGSILTPAAFVAYVLNQGSGSGFTIHYDLILLLAPIVFVFAFIGSRWGLEKLKTRVVKTIFTGGVYLAATQMIYSLLSA
jgi:uncharacterized membrane protein YfcA